MEIEKEELQEEYEDLAIQFDGYQNMEIRNDSLQDLLSKEQQRVQDLLEELRQTKASNARRIAELKKELATVRAVMKDYVRQIDSRFWDYYGWRLYDLYLRNSTCAQIKAMSGFPFNADRIEEEVRFHGSDGIVLKNGTVIPN